MYGTVIIYNYIVPLKVAQIREDGRMFVGCFGSVVPRLPSSHDVVKKVSLLSGSACEGDCSE